MKSSAFTRRGAEREKRWTKEKPAAQTARAQPKSIIVQARQTWPAFYGDGGKREVEEAVEASKSIRPRVEGELGGQQKRKAPQGVSRSTGKKKK